jgi:hypothetical protein
MARRLNSARNPRYTAVAIDLDGDDTHDLVVIVKGGRRQDAIRAVARSLPADARIDMQETRVFRAKYVALAHAQDLAGDIREIEIE